MRPRPDLTARPALPTLLAAGLLTLAAPAQAAPGTLRDFRLPPDPDAPTAEPAPQGPVAPDVPASGQVLRPTPTAAPSAAPAPATASTTSPVVQPVPVPTVTPPAPSASRSPRQTGQTPAAPTEPTMTSTVEGGAGAAPSPSPTTTAATPFPLPASPPSAEEEAGEESSGLPWLWIVSAVLALAALGCAAWFLRRRPRSRSAETVLEIERPTLAPEPAVPASPPASAAPIPTAPAEPAAAEPITGPGLDLELEPQRLSLTLMNATLSYRLLLNNRGAEPIEALTITADMIAAHAALSREQQLSGPDANAMQVASIARLEPGESRTVSGEFRLPFAQIMPVRQGNAALLFPLARFRVTAGEQEPLTRTFLVAQPPERAGAGLQPFRLDLGPRVYPKLAQRAFA